MCVKIAYGFWKKRSTVSSVRYLVKKWKKLASSSINQSVKSQKQWVHTIILLLWQKVCLKRHQHQFIIVLNNWTFRRHHWNEFCIKFLVWCHTQFNWLKPTDHPMRLRFAKCTRDRLTEDADFGKKNHLFRWSSFWSWRVCKEAKLSHLVNRKPARHTAKATLDVLRLVFEDCIISRRADVVWPPRSWDLTQLDYYLWACADKAETIDALKYNIREAIGEVQLHTIDNVLKNWTYGLGYCMANRGSHLKKLFSIITEGLYFQIKKEIWENIQYFFKHFPKKRYLADPICWLVKFFFLFVGLYNDLLNLMPVKNLYKYTSVVFAFVKQQAVTERNSIHTINAMQ